MFDFSLAHAADALRVVKKLQSAGFTAYLAGGCVRDGLLGRQAKDFDVATDATPDTVRSVFGGRQTLAFGASFGVIGVLGDAGTPTEVATFRSDGTYSDGRRPDSVRFGTAQQDALRRDFTINGMFYDPAAKEVIDFVGGQTDLREGVVRAIGDAELRIGEDKLRMLRAVRFAASLRFRLDQATFEAIGRMAHEVTVVSGERIAAEMRRMLASPGAADALELLDQTGLLERVWPGLPPSRLPDAIATARLVDPPDFTSCVAALTSECSIEPLVVAERLSEIWKLSIQESRAIRQAILHFRTILEADRLPWSKVQPILATRDAEVIVAVAGAVGMVQGIEMAGVRLCRERLAWPPEQLDPAPLLSGSHLIAAGYRPGPEFARVLQDVRAAQLDARIGSVDQAIAMANQRLGR